MFSEHQTKLDKRWKNHSEAMIRDGLCFGKERNSYSFLTLFEQTFCLYNQPIDIYAIVLNNST